MKNIIRKLLDACVYAPMLRMARLLHKGQDTDWPGEKWYYRFDEALEWAYKVGAITPKQHDDMANLAFYDYLGEYRYYTEEWWNDWEAGLVDE